MIFFCGLNGIWLNFRHRSLAARQHKRKHRRREKSGTGFLTYSGHLTVEQPEDNHKRQARADDVEDDESCDQNEGHRLIGSGCQKIAAGVGRLLDG